MRIAILTILLILLNIPIVQSADSVWGDEGYTWMARILKSFSQAVQYGQSKTFVEQDLQKLPNSKSYFKNGAYVGQHIFIGKRPFMFVHYKFKDGRAVVVNAHVGHIKPSGEAAVYDLLHTSLAKNYRETKKNVFQVGGGYYAFLDKSEKAWSVQVLYAKQSVVQ